MAKCTGIRAAWWVETRGLYNDETLGGLGNTAHTRLREMTQRLLRIVR